ncbi:hypothetical protein BLNAU_16095 [Blattamonas nauphoetae]|uniref:RNA polymerase II assembly factor Rtp1 C-terminal domain-containing protein n=1 Tax=Blattamonas nauphoetae TaxID=2049346 RepID=A0ABQ9XC71_9EUKA|nr:hypothetical protein BLNAU_16095 [Blattamonas nauphoetae]
MQYPPTNQIIAPLSPTNRRAKGRRMRQVQMPECPEDVIENLHRYPLLVWYDSTASKDSEDSLLKDKFVKTLRSLIASKCAAGEEVEWQDLMEWFVCAVIGLDSKRSQSNRSFWFDWDDVVVDGFGTARINLSASHSDSSPPHSPQSFSDGVTRLSQLFLEFVKDLSTSNCLSLLTEQYSPNNMLLSILHHLIHHLVNVGHLIPDCDPSEFEKIVGHFINKYIDSKGFHLDMIDDLRLIPLFTYILVSTLEDQVYVLSEDRLTDTDIDTESPKYSTFLHLIAPAFIEIKKQFDPDVFEEARRISSWKERLQKVAGGEEVENDTSFLKLPFFRPTLLSLQAKFQQLTSSKDADDNSTSSLHSSHSSPHTSLAAHLDSSLRTHTSAAQFKQESLKLLTILHSLLTSPLPPSLTEHTPTDLSAAILTVLQYVPINLNENFKSSLFDEADDEKLARSLMRCRSVCELVGAENCIDDIPEFFDRTISALGSSDRFVRAAGFLLIVEMIDTSCVIPLLPRVLDRLRSAFRDGQPEEQIVLLQISTKWNLTYSQGHSLPPFPAKEFDWDGLIRADLSFGDTLIDTIYLIMLHRHPSIDDQIEKTKATQFLLSFEQHQQAVSKIVSILEERHRKKSDSGETECLLSFCLLISLLSSSDFPPTLTTFLVDHPDITGHFHPLPHVHKTYLLCHASLNPRKPHQPPLDLLFERTLRMNPVFFIFSDDSSPSIDLPPTLLDTSLCGFHAFFRRGIHLILMGTDDVIYGHHLANLFWMFTTPLATDTFELFVSFPPPLVVRFFLPILSLQVDSTYSRYVDILKGMISTLLIFTAPFGDLHSVRELSRYIDDKDTFTLDRMIELVFPSQFECLALLNIPTGFGPILDQSSTDTSLDHFESFFRRALSIDDSVEPVQFNTDMSEFLSEQASNVKKELSAIGAMTRDLNSESAAMHAVDIGDLKRCAVAILSPVPAEVSVYLEFVKRVVSLCSVESVMEMVRFGMLEIVIRGVSESSFLEDYENGICVIGILLRSICEFGNEQEMVSHDFSRLLSQTELS